MNLNDTVSLERGMACYRIIDVGPHEPGAITVFSGRYRFLSNFARTPFFWCGYPCPTAEHAYQSMKTDDPAWRKRIRDAQTAADAKRLGQQAPLGHGWNGMRIDAMRRVLAAKFKSGSVSAAMLLNTGDAQLIEGNNWGDQFWGVCDGKGENHLGLLLMERRNALRSNQH